MDQHGFWRLAALTSFSRNEALEEVRNELEAQRALVRQKEGVFVCDCAELRASGDALWCSACRIRLYDNHFGCQSGKIPFQCQSCQHLLCGDCIVRQCSFCDPSLFCSGCLDSYDCDDCFQKNPLCHDHMNICEECQNTLCPDHWIDCTSCSDGLHEKCAVSCIECGEMVCRECAADDEHCYECKERK